MLISSPPDFCHAKCQAPPARRSTSHTGIVQPGGPSIQFGMCSGFVQASNTSARDASNTRVISISVSEGVANVVSPTLSVVVIVDLLPLQSFEVLVQPVVARIPEVAVLLRELGDLLERSGIERARPPLRLPPALNEPGALEHAKVLRDSRPAHGERLGQLLDRRLPPSQPAQDRAPGGIGQSRERHAESVALLIHNQKVSKPNSYLQVAT